VPEPAAPPATTSSAAQTGKIAADVTTEPPPVEMSSKAPSVSDPAPAAEPIAIESFARLDYPEPETAKVPEVLRDVLPLESASPAQVETNRDPVGEPSVPVSDVSATPELVMEEEPVVTSASTVWPEPATTTLEHATGALPGARVALPEAPEAPPVGRWSEMSTVPGTELVRPEPTQRWDHMAVATEPSALSHGLDPASSARLRQIVALLAPIAPFEATVQSMEGVSVYALTAPAVSGEIAGAATGLALPLLTERRSPWPIDQLTLRGAETALVLTPLGQGRGPVLATAAPRGGALALLEILSRRAVDGGRGSSESIGGAGPDRRRSLTASAVGPIAASQTSSFTAFGTVTASVFRDTEGEAMFYFFLPPGVDVPTVGAFAQDLQAVMRKAAGSGAVFQSAVLRSGGTIVVIQPEEVGHGRSIVVVAGGDVTRPGLAYRQVERAIATLAQA
jgi:hypothetical protein